MTTKEYYAAHREQGIAYSVQYLKDRPEYKKQSNLKYRERHVEERKTYSSEYYQRTRLAQLSKRKDQITKKRTLLINAHGGHCAACGYNRNIAALEFHHVIPLEKEGREVYSMKEAEKCVLLCNRCHREHHCGGIEYSNDTDLKTGKPIKESKQ